MLSQVRLKKGEDRRIRLGHPWIFSNEIDTGHTRLKDFAKGQEVKVLTHDLRFLGMGYINPHSLIAVRLFSRNDDESLNQDFIYRKLKSALTFRERLFREPYYRLIFSEADQLPGLIIDRFSDDIVLQVNTAGMENVTSLIVNSILDLIPTTRSILLKNDSTIREQESLTRFIKSAFGNPPEKANVIENDTRFSIPLLRGQKTGWFYDHRLNRKRLQHYVKNQNVLDVFSYVGAFGIQAGVLGAKEVDCIEASQFAADYIRENAQLNNVDTKIKIFSEDAFIAMRNLINNGKKYNVIILDPPAFVKKSKDLKEGLLAYQRLNELAVHLLSDDGILLSCSCSMHVSMEDLMQIIKRTGVRTQNELQIIERGHQGPDHPLHPAIPETDYLKALFVRKVGKS